MTAAGLRTAAGVSPLTEAAADAAIGAACRTLHLPTVRAQAAELADAAARDRSTPRGYLAELLTAETDARDARRRDRRVKEATSPGANAWTSSTCTPRLASRRPPWPPWPAAPGSTAASRWSCSATVAPARPICSSGSASPPASRAAACAI